MTVAVDWPDVEKAALALLDAHLPAVAPSATSAIGVPTDWTAASGVHVQVAQDSPLRPTAAVEAVAAALVRVTVWAPSTSEAKRVSCALWGRLLAHDGSAPVAGVRPSMGPLPAQDPDTHAELASFVVDLTVRSVPI